jgi:hypothetical protein
LVDVELGVVVVSWVGVGKGQGALTFVFRTERRSSDITPTWWDG